MKKTLGWLYRLAALDDVTRLPGATAFEGKYYSWGPVESNPKPVQQPGVPIVVGGHVPGAARRAARVGDGFWPNVSIDKLPGLLDAMSDECGKTGRDPGEIEVTCGLAQPTVDFVKQMEDLGVSRLIMPPPGRTTWKSTPIARSFTIGR